MPIGTSDGEYFEDGMEQRLAEPKKLYMNMSSPDIEDRRDMSAFGSMTAGLSLGSLGQKVSDIYKYGPMMSGPDRGMAVNSESIPPETELSKQLGTGDIPNQPSIPNISKYDWEDIPFSKGTELGNKLFGSWPEKHSESGPGTTQFTTASPLVNITDKDIETGMNVALSAGAGTMAGVKSAAIKGKLADLGHAQVLEANGEHPDKILKDTGFFRGTDSRWRYEIDDSKAGFDSQWATDNLREVLNKKGEVIGHQAKLTDVLDHPELYKAYPQLKEVTLVHNPKLNNAGAYWDAANRAIVTSTAHTINQGSIMHEIQHAIQDIEGFAKGGSPMKADEDFVLKYGKSNMSYKIAKGKLDYLLEKAQKEGLTPEEENEFLDLNKIQKTYIAYRKAANEKASEYYLRLAGEAEARNVDTRLYMTEAERRQVPPRSTEDVNPRNQIVIKSDHVGTSAYGVRDPKTGQIYK